jgi:hypothetical protein
MGKSSSADQSAAQAQEAQSRLAQQLVGETTPLRRGLIGQAEDFLGGGFDVTGLPQFGAGKQMIEDQFARAQDAVIAGTPEGGGLTSALVDLNTNRAGGLAQLTGGLAQDEINRALQLATFGTAQGSQGMTQASVIAAQRANAEAQQNAAKASGLGQAAGAGLAMATKGSGGAATGAAK